MAVTEKGQSVPSVQHGKQQDSDPQTPSTIRLDAPSQYTSTFHVNNIHCQSCVSYVKDILNPLPNLVSIDISIADHTIRIQHQGSSTTSTILKELQDAAFDVEHVKVCDGPGSVINEYDTTRQISKTPRWSSTLFMPKAQRKHIENCNACKEETMRKNMRSLGGAMPSRSRFLSRSRTTKTRPDTPNEKPFVIDVDAQPTQEHKDATEAAETFKAMISIGGMTCASCVGTITKELDTVEFVTSASVSLVANNATISFKGPRDNVDKIVEAIEDLGYEAVLDEVQPLHNQTTSSHPSIFRATLSLEGMTCGSCVGTITRGLEGLEVVRSINIDLIGCSGIVEFEGKENLDQVLEKIDDLGYDAKVVKIEGVESNTVSEDEMQTADRTITFAVVGMYCEHCPGRVVRALLDAVESSIRVSQEPTLRNPRLTLTYAPSPPDSSARRFISIIEASDKALSVKIDRPPTIEERSRAIQHREQRHILWRLIFTFIVAIPTFVIGIVLMSLVPSTNKARVYLSQPIWAGTVTRSEWAMFIMTTPVMFFGADLFHRRSFKEIRALWRPGSKVPVLRRFYRFGSMNLLISAGTSVAYFASLAVLILDAGSTSENSTKMSSNNTYFDSVTFLSFFILIGRFLEAYSKAKTGDAVAMLSNLRPSEALLVESSKAPASDGSDGSQESKTIADADKGSTTTRIPVDLLEVGDTVIVPHGASPPTDGVVAQSETCIFDESSLTGESKPVKKHENDKVFAGSINISQPLRMTVTEIGGTSMLDQIVAVVREGQTKRAPIERVADTITGYFVPVITLIAILVFVIWLGLGESGRLPRSWLDVEQGGWTFWALEFAISVFVVACPCGIALAAPTALFVGGGLAAKRGILVRGGGEAFQEASKLDVVVFDKTGTLTEGKMQVTDCDVISKGGGLDVPFAAAKGLEESSNHPIAKAIVEYCDTKTGTTQPTVVDADIEEVPGKGMAGTLSLRHASSPEVHRYNASIGNEALTADRQENVFLSKTLHKFQSQGKSTAILSLRPADSSERQRETLLVFAISDPLRPTTGHVLHTMNNTHKIEAHICTGDNATTALAIAAQLDVPSARVRAGVLPADKAAYIKELQQGDNGKRRIVAFVGDGTNDAAALAAADVSIALSSGSDVAVNAASFILLNPDLATVLELVRLAKRVFWRVKANFVWAGVYNVCLVPVAAGVFYTVGGRGWRLGPVWASAAMAASSVSVVTSSLALRLPECNWEAVKGTLGLGRR